MTRSGAKTAASTALALLALIVSGCDAWSCWFANTQATPLNPDYLQPTGGASDVAAQPVYLSASPDDSYVAVSSQGDGSGLGMLSLVRADGSSPVTQAPIGDGPYGIQWIGTNRVLVCNEGLPGVGGNASLLSVTFTRGSDNPLDDAYNDLTIGDPNDPTVAVAIDPNNIVGPSEIASLPGTNLIVLVTLRYPAGLFMVNLAGATASSQRLLPDGTTGHDPLDEPRGIAITPDGTTAWICNYGDGADSQIALQLAQELIAAKLNLLRGVAPADVAALNQAVADADQWIIDHRDPDGRLPARWADPTDEPDEAAQTQAAGLIETLVAYNIDVDCADPNDANCPLSATQWATVDPSLWPTDPNVDPNDPAFGTLVLGDPNRLDDPNDPNDLDNTDRYEYVSAQAADVFTILSRPVGENGTITIYSLALGRLVGSVVVPPRPRSIRFTSDGTLAVITCAGNDGTTGSVAIASVSAQAVIVQRTTPFVPAHVRLSPLGGRAYVSGWTGNQMAVINLNGLCTSTLPDTRDTRFYTVLDRPAPLGVTSDADILWGGSFSQGQVTQLDAFEGAVRVSQ